MKKINRYDEEVMSIEAREELLEELKADENVKNITVERTGAGWLVEWEEG